VPFESQSSRANVQAKKNRFFNTMTNTEPQLVFKLTTVDEWSAAIVGGTYTGSPDDLRDGFIHLSAAHQVGETAARYFSGVEDLCLVAFNSIDLGQSLTWEVSRGGDKFPHFYGQLPATDAIWVRPVPLDENGKPIVESLTTDALAPLVDR
jgi:uncharacterized protein (DUF952 family)